MVTVVVSLVVRQMSTGRGSIRYVCVSCGRRYLLYGVTSVVPFCLYSIGANAVVGVSVVNLIYEPRCLLWSSLPTGVMGVNILVLECVYSNLFRSKQLSRCYCRSSPYLAIIFDLSKFSSIFNCLMYYLDNLCHVCYSLLRCACDMLSAMYALRTCGSTVFIDCCLSFCLLRKVIQSTVGLLSSQYTIGVLQSLVEILAQLPYLGQVLLLAISNQLPYLLQASSYSTQIVMCLIPWLES